MNWARGIRSGRPPGSCPHSCRVRHQITRVCEAGCIDRRGPHCSGGELTVAEAYIPHLAAWLVRFLSAIGNNGSVMVTGHDIGGGIAQYLLTSPVDVPRPALVNAVM